MRKLKLLLVAFMAMLGSSVYAADYKIDQRFTTIDELNGKLFAVVDETSTKAIGFGVPNHGNGWDMYFGTYAEAYTSNACYFKISAASGDGAEGYYYLQAYKLDGTLFNYSWAAGGYFNSQTGAGGYFALGLNGQNGQDAKNHGVWNIEVKEGKFALKNIGTGKYLHADQVSNTYSDPFYFTFGTLVDFDQLKTDYNALKANVLALDDDATLFEGSPTVDISAAETAIAAASTQADIDAAMDLLRDAANTFISSVTMADGKSLDITGIYITNPSFESELAGWTNKGMQKQGNTSFEKVGNIYAEAWQPSGIKSVSQTVTLPSGLYRLSAKSKARGVTSAKLFAGKEETAITVSDVTGSYNVEFKCVDGATIGFEGVGTGAKDSWLCVDNFQLAFVRQITDEEKIAFGKAEYDAALLAATTAYNAHANAQNGSEGTALKAEIDKTEPTTLEGYLSAAEVLKTKTATFNSGYANYDLYASELTIAQAISNTITVDVPTTSAEALAAFKTLKVAEYNFVKTAYPYSATSKIGEFTTWTRTGTVNGAEKNKFDPLTSQHWSGEARTYYEQPATGWESGMWTANYTKTTTLPAGEYVIKVAARAATTGVAAKITCSAAAMDGPIPNLGDTGKGITTAGVASFDEGTFANNGNGRGFVWNYLPFKLDAETEVTMTVVAEANAQFCWFSVCDGELLSKTNIATAVAYDEAADNTIEDVDVANVTMTRGIKASYNTVVLPFALTASQVASAFGAGTEVYTFSENSDAADNATVSFTKDVSGAITANVPVLIKATAASSSLTFEGVQVVAPTTDVKVAGKNFDFVGTYAPIATIAAGDYFIGAGKVYKSAGATSMNAFRAYIKAKDANASIANFYIDGVETTAVEALAIAGKNNGKLYNLNGQEVKNAQKGIYIQNGKKVVIK